METCAVLTMFRRRIVNIYAYEIVIKIYTYIMYMIAMIGLLNSFPSYNKTCVFKHSS